MELYKVPHHDARHGARGAQLEAQLEVDDEGDEVAEVDKHRDIVGVSRDKGGRRHCFSRFSVFLLLGSLINI